MFQEFSIGWSREKSLEVNYVHCISVSLCLPYFSCSFCLMWACIHKSMSEDAHMWTCGSCCNVSSFITLYFTYWSSILPEPREFNSASLAGKFGPGPPSPMLALWGLPAGWLPHLSGFVLLFLWKLEIRNLVEATFFTVLSPSTSTHHSSWAKCKFHIYMQISQLKWSASFLYKRFFFYNLYKRSFLYNLEWLWKLLQHSIVHALQGFLWHILCLLVRCQRCLISLYNIEARDGLRVCWLQLDTQQLPFHACLVSEGIWKTILVLEVSELICSELIRASYSPGKARPEWCPQGKSSVEEQPTPKKEGADSYKSDHKSPSAVLVTASWKSWAASSMKRNQIPLPGVLPTEEGTAPSVGHSSFTRQSPFLLLERLMEKENQQMLPFTIDLGS